MVLNEFEPDDVFGELNQKFANVSLEQSNHIEDVYREIAFDDLFEYRDTLEYSSNYASCHSAMKNIRRYLTQKISLDRIQNVIDLDIQDRIKKILETPGYDELKYETAWTITNIAYGTKEHTSNLIQSGVIDSLIYCFRTTDSFRVKSQSAWALANVSIESPKYRETMAQGNLIGIVAFALAEKCEIVYNKLSSAINQELITNNDQGQIVCNSKSDTDDVKDLTWSLANICRGGFKTAEHWEQYLLAFDAFSQCVHFDNSDIWTEACWGLSRILSNMYNYDPFFAALELHPRLCPRLIQLLRNEAAVTILPVLQTISNFSSGPNEYIEILLNADLLNTIWWYMSSDTPSPLRRNAILTISNLAAGNESIVRKVVYNENIMRSVISHVTAPGHLYHAENRSWISSPKAPNEDTKEEWRIVKEALWVLSNITTLANDDCICALLRNYSRLIKLLAALLHYPLLPFPICLKVVDVLIRIVDRTSQIAELTPPVLPIPRNPYAEEILEEGVISSLKFLCEDFRASELDEQVEILRLATMYSSSQLQQSEDNRSAAGLGSAFGLSRRGISLSRPNIRRIVHGFEDGDVRFIEDAIKSITL
ncbi:armadillo-type protein [Parasitella parasitica]|nr:armadillo-type protein [Parasitella parasitica]